MKAQEFIDILKEVGYNFFTGVPCTILSQIILTLIDDPDVTYISAPREDAALGLATGAYLAGKMPVVLMQNSGLGYSLNCLTSLQLLYRIPCLIIISWRGFGGKDAPEHQIMGRIISRILEIAGVPYRILTPFDILETIQEITNLMRMEQLPVTLLLKEGIIR